MYVVGSFNAGNTSFARARMPSAVGMLSDVSQLLTSKVPPSSTNPGVEGVARGITYVDFSASAVPDIIHHYNSGHLER